MTAVVLLLLVSVTILGILFPNDPTNAQYSQHYLYDPGDADAARLRRNPDLDARTLVILSDMMEESSPYVRNYHHMRDIIAREPNREVKLGFTSDVEVDMRRYNHPQLREPAAVFVGQEGAPETNRDIVVWPRDEATFRISELSEHVDPLAYPLLFPSGDPGWTPTLKHDLKKRTAAYTRVTAMQFFSHRLMVRQQSEHCSENILHHAAGLLFQQYVCDAYSRAEAQRLAWLRLNQADLRIEEYTGLYDAVHNVPEGSDIGRVGTPVILPSSYPGIIG